MAEKQDIDPQSAAAKLDPVNAFFLQNSESRSVPLSNEKEVQIAWNYSTDDDYSTLERFLSEYTWPTNKDTKRRYIENPVVAGMKLDGVWRQAFISRVERFDSSRNLEMLIVLTLRRGWAKEIDWTEALLVSRKDKDGNDVSVTDVDNTTSFNDASSVVIRFPNINPYKIHACMASLSAATFDDPKVQDQTLTGTWYKAFVEGGRADDGSGVIQLVLSRQRFTLQLYQNYGTVRQSSIYKLYDVPRSLAQTIVDDWKEGTEGRSADISLNTDSELCVVTLVDRDASKDNLTSAWVKDACDRFVRYHFAWGYTKEELDEWIKVHDGQLNSQAVPGDEGADTQPISRRISIRERGDGLFNAEIEERKFDNSDPTTPDFTITLPTGTAITRRQDYGWNYKSSEMSAAALKDSYDTTVAEDGRTVQFDVTRQDDCSFDWRAIITEATVDGAGLGTVDEPEIRFSNLRPAWNRYGYEDTFSVFKNVPPEDIQTYDMQAAEYGFLERLTLSDDGLLSGVKVVRDYTGASGWATPVLSEPEDVTDREPSGVAPTEYEIYRVQWDTRGTNIAAYVFRYTIEELWDTDYGKVINFINGGLDPSNITKSVVNGGEIFHAVSCRKVEVSRAEYDGATPESFDVSADFSAVLTVVGEDFTTPVP
jgi:hypothetical protein